MSQKWVHPLYFSKKNCIISQGTIPLKWNLDIYFSVVNVQQIYCPLNITQHIAIIVQITGNKNEYTLSEHVKTVSKMSIFCRGTIVI